MSAATAPPPRDPPADRLRELAARVRRLGVSGRTDPEQVTVEKYSIAAELRALARHLEAAS